ncbi:isochorismatase family protein [Methylocystis silviterrae]|uniref:isochorismatase family protein n=1 Tax=Methylocystis silviterrae TaxID=2743612 RepID=UPI003C71AD9F
MHRVLIVGLAQNFCVRETALDAIAAGFETLVRLSATHSITLRGGQDAVDALRGAGVIVEEN